MVFNWFKKKSATQELAPGSESAQTLEARPNTAHSKQSAEIPHDKIVARAYEIWIRKGQPSGQDFQNWMEAEAELRAELYAQSGDEPLPRKSR